MHRMKLLLGSASAMPAWARVVDLGSAMGPTWPFTDIDLRKAIDVEIMGWSAQAK